MKIAFFTTCMNRLKHLRRTLPKNIADNKDYDNCVFVVLNYNSQDGLHEWMLKEMAAEIKGGKSFKLLANVDIITGTPASVIADKISVILPVN